MPHIRAVEGDPEDGLILSKGGNDRIKSPSCTGCVQPGRKEMGRTTVSTDGRMEGSPEGRGAGPGKRSLLGQLTRPEFTERQAGWEWLGVHSQSPSYAGGLSLPPHARGGRRFRRSVGGDGF